MCGIVGAVNSRQEALVGRMLAALQHRGPDGQGDCRRRNVHIGASRLSLLDLTSGSQPIYDETGRLCVVFNGEIYNHAELRLDLERRGHTFVTKTDTEVLIHLYEEAGENLVQHLHGMFTFAILDGERLVLARDRLGIKPLYYAYLPHNQLFLFASEIKAILQCPQFTPRLDMKAFADSVAVGYPMGNATFFEGIKSLRPGHVMTVTLNDQLQISEQPYYTTVFNRDEALSLDEAQEILELTLDRAVTEHLKADVSVGITLSGGLDSTLLASLAKEQGTQPLFTFSVADDDRHPDIVQAGIVAQVIGSDHLPVIMSFADFLGAIPGCIEAEERPSSLYAVPFYFMCGRIASRVKACLHGEGADELFGGYPEYVDQQYTVRSFNRRLTRLMRFGLAPSNRAMSMLEQLCSVEVPGQYLANIFQVYLSDQLQQYHLDPVDKCAMAAGVEMRVPYLDDAVVELACRLPVPFLVRMDLGIQKYILKRMALKRFDLTLADVVLRRKIGIPAAGMRSLRRFNELCEKELPDDYLGRHDLGYCFERKRDLFIFELFLEVFMKYRGDSQQVGSVLDSLSLQCGRNVAITA